jgi:mannosyltransferase OCH1-like enzyme
MIPKIIHYCWVSETIPDTIPEEFLKYIKTWKKLSDYTFMLWNFNRFDINSSIWVKEAWEAKKYAFVADYIRLYAVYHFGGIYLGYGYRNYQIF